MYCTYQLGKSVLRQHFFSSSLLKLITRAILIFEAGSVCVRHRYVIAPSGICERSGNGWVHTVTGPTFTEPDSRTWGKGGLRWVQIMSWHSVVCFAMSFQILLLFQLLKVYYCLSMKDTGSISRPTSASPGVREPEGLWLVFCFLIQMAGILSLLASCPSQSDNLCLVLSPLVPSYTFVSCLRTVSILGTFLGYCNVSLVQYQIFSLFFFLLVNVFFF